MIYIVTRHEGVVKWLRSKGYHGTVIPHLIPKDIVQDSLYIGILPIPLIKAILDKGSRFFLLTLPDMGFSERGSELTPEEMDLAGATLTEVTRIEISAVDMKGSGFAQE